MVSSSAASRPARRRSRVAVMSDLLGVEGARWRLAPPGSVRRGGRGSPLRWERLHLRVAVGPHLSLPAASTPVAADHPELVRAARGLDARMHVELLEDVGEVGADGLAADEEAGPALAGGGGVGGRAAHPPPPRAGGRPGGPGPL